MNVNLKSLNGNTLYFASGATSNLCITTGIIQSYIENGAIVYATVRDVVSQGALLLEKIGVKFISTNDSLNDNFKIDMIFWFSTHNDVELLEKYSKKAPTLFIASGAIMEYYGKNKKVPSEKDYGYGKYLMAQLPDVYIFVPGFILDDCGYNTYRNGLHSNGSKTIFGDDNQDADNYFKDNNKFDWTKSYSVTPKSMMINAVNYWVINNTQIPKGNPIIICSDRQYCRFELRELAGYNIPTKLKNEQFNNYINKNEIYKDYYHIKDISFDEEIIKSACVKTSKFYATK